MKLIFLGDSFLEGVGIDIEYAINKGLLKNEKEYYYTDRRKIDSNFSSIIYDFQKNNCWPSLLCNEINIENDNFSRGASGGDLLFLQLLKSEENNKNKKRFYIIGLPKLNQGRIMISNENRMSINKLLYFFHGVVFYNKLKDLDFYKKYFDKNFFYIYYLNFLMSIINYLKSKKINFLFLPTWESSIKEHFFKEKINEDEQILFDYYERFFFSELGDQMNFKINNNDLEYLPCRHANIKSQYLIKDMYKNYILEKIK